MTLRDTIQAIEAAALAQPSVRSIVPSDVYRLNAMTDAQYGVFAWQQGQHTSPVLGDTHSFTFTLIYIDRLLSDRSNETEIQSTGVATLESVVNTLASRGIATGNALSFTAFNQRFADECAGVYCTVTLAVPTQSVCVTDYEGGEVPVHSDFNDDFNLDFN